MDPDWGQLSQACRAELKDGLEKFSAAAVHELRAAADSNGTRDALEALFTAVGAAI